MQLVGITVAKVNFGDGVRVVGVAEEGALQGRHRHSEMLILMSDRLVAPMHFYLRGHLKQKQKNYLSSQTKKNVPSKFNGEIGPDPQKWIDTECQMAPMQLSKGEKDM